MAVLAACRGPRASEPAPSHATGASDPRLVRASPETELRYVDKVRALCAEQGIELWVVPPAERDAERVTRCR